MNLLALLCTTITNTSISIPLNLLEKSLYKTMSNEEMDELETCIKREILSIHVKHRERKKETAEKISMTYLRNGIATFKEEDKERNDKIGIPRWVLDGWVGSWKSNPFFGRELYDNVCMFFYISFHTNHT